MWSGLPTVSPEPMPLVDIETYQGRLMAWELAKPSAALTTYFPAEFTTILSGDILPWPEFTKLVDGTYYDIWTRSKVPERALFANRISVLPFREIVEQFDTASRGST